MRNFYLPNSTLRQILFIIVALVSLIVVLYNLSSFIPGFLGAFCLYVLLIHPLQWMMRHWKLNKLLSVILLMIGSFIIVITPMIFLINMLTKKVSSALENKEDIQSKIELGLSKINEETGVDLLKEINIGDITSLVFKLIQEILNTSINGVIQIGVAYLILYFMLMNYKKMENWFYTNIPLRSENLTILNKDLRGLVISNAVGVPLVALIQAIVAYVGYLIFGLDDAFNWFILTIFAAMLPVVGAAIIYIPASLYLMANGETTNAYLLLIYSFVVVGLSDNIFRFWLQKIMADIHPLITIFGVIFGVNLFGFIGIIFGPIFMSLVIWLFRIYKLEFSNTKEILKEEE
ncbi:MAG: AI-2E family transporter [Weeksellaceae bacterium]|jgi:predicted PurR-regulated permease PerM|nr:AI-2E family transporter [Weeksellaceae bacterium]